MNNYPDNDKTMKSNAQEYSVTELSLALKRSVEDQFGYVKIRGEISGFKRAASGHVYLALKDEKSLLDGVMWKGVAGKLTFKPEDGLEVICIGKLTTYPGRSKYQIVIDRMEVAGEGALMALLEKRKKKLASEGLFDEDRKISIPYIPKTVGVVTSPTGSVIRDILHRFSDRFPRNIIVWPVLVQGEGSASQIAKAINGFNTLEVDGKIPRPDVLIVARGGGSLEDLWSFNEEVVVRAVSRSKIPLISAVGHETDTTLIDYVSDHRSPTPTAAAERAVPVRVDLTYAVNDFNIRLEKASRRHLNNFAQIVQSLGRGLPKPTELLSFSSQRLDDLSERLPRALKVGVERQEMKLRSIKTLLRPETLKSDIRVAGEKLVIAEQRTARALSNLIVKKRNKYENPARLLESLSYQSVLKRGFSIVYNEQGKALSNSKAIKNGDKIGIEFCDGAINAVATAQNAKPGNKKKSNLLSHEQGQLL